MSILSEKYDLEQIRWKSAFLFLSLTDNISAYLHGTAAGKKCGTDTNLCKLSDALFQAEPTGKISRASFTSVLQRRKTRQQKLNSSSLSSLNIQGHRTAQKFSYIYDCFDPQRSDSMDWRQFLIALRICHCPTLSPDDHIMWGCSLYSSDGFLNSKKRYGAKYSHGGKGDSDVESEKISMRHLRRTLEALLQPKCCDEVMTILTEALIKKAVERGEEDMFFRGTQNIHFDNLTVRRSMFEDLVRQSTAAHLFRTKESAHLFIMESR